MTERVAPAIQRWLRIGAVAALVILLVCGVAVASPVPLLPFSTAGIGLIAQVAAVAAALLLPAQACAVTLGRGRLVAGMLLGLAVIGVTILLWYVAIAAFQFTGESTLFRVSLASALVLSVPAIGVGFAASLFRRPGATALALGAAWIAVAGLVIVLGMFVSMIVDDLLASWAGVGGALHGDDRSVQVIFAIGIGMLMTGLATAAVAQSKREIETAAGGASAFDVAVTCPRCEATQVIRSGGAPCERCRLRIVVEAV